MTEDPFDRFETVDNLMLLVDARAGHAPPVISELCSPAGRPVGVLEITHAHSDDLDRVCTEVYAVPWVAFASIEAQIRAWAATLPDERRADYEAMVAGWLPGITLSAVEARRAMDSMGGES